MLQPLDTHVFACLKQAILRAKARAHEQEEAAFRRVGLAYKPSWAPRQLANVLADAWPSEQARARDTPWILECALENQLWIWRPDAQGDPILVDDDPSLQDLHRDPPSKGIVPKRAQESMGNSP